MIRLSLEEFAAQRRTMLENLDERLLPLVALAFEDDRQPLLDELALIFAEVFIEEGGESLPRPAVERYIRQVTEMLEKASEDSVPLVTAKVLSTSVINAATVEATNSDPEDLYLEWVTMRDSDVREAHQETHGQQRPPGVPFDVAGVEMDYPGDPRAPIELWINCRCVLRPTLPDETLVAGGGMEDELGLIPWYGVLAPEGVWSGDKRRFSEGALTFPELPIPLTWQKTSDDGHKGSVVVGDISQVERRGNLIHGSGHFLATPEADQAVGLVAHFGKFGVSIDADSAEMALEDDDEGITFSSARVRSASMVSIPAFTEAYITLGVEEASDTSPEFAVSDKSWDGSAGRFTPEEWKRSCILHLDDSLNKSSHKLPIKEPGGALSRAGVHAAAARIGQVDAPSDKIAAAKRALRAAYRTLGEDAPESLAEEPLTFKRGAGWLTNPADTKRIHDYWTKPGQEGYRKINWGVAGDFNRCRTLVGEKIAGNSPEDMRYINQICARWHHDALGAWPGRAPSEQRNETVELQTEPAEALTLVAAAGHQAPAAWFTNPNLERLTPLTITEEGQVYGHLAGWETCHTGFKDMCQTAPHSATNYAYFLTGEVGLDSGQTVPVGNITIGGGHADPKLRAKPALAHYDAATSAVCDVTAGEDEHGIWLAGWVRPGVDDDKVTALRASSLSGDWRRIGGSLELIAALAVNAPGFPVPRVKIAAQGQQQISLVAAGIVQNQGETLEDGIEDFAERIAAALEARAQRREKMAALRERILGRN